MSTGSKNSKERLTPSQARAARRARRNRRRRLLRIGGATAIAAVSFLFILGLFLPGTPFGSGGGSGTGDGLWERVDDAGRGHIKPGEERRPYTSVPATSGQHFAIPLAPVRWGSHQGVLEPEEYVHNLEHGGIGIFYDCEVECDSLKNQLEELTETAVKNGLKVIVAPHSETGSVISLAAWNYLDQFEVFDEERVKAFIYAHESSPNSPEPLSR